MCTMDDDRAPPISSLSQLYPKPMLVVKLHLKNSNGDQIPGFQQKKKGRSRIKTGPKQNSMLFSYFLSP